MAESGAFSIADWNGFELLEKESKSDTEKDSEKDLTEKKLCNDFSTDASKYLLASPVTTKAFNSIRFTLDGAYQKIVVPPPET